MARFQRTSWGHEPEILHQTCVKAANVPVYLPKSEKRQAHLKSPIPLRSSCPCASPVIGSIPTKVRKVPQDYA